MKGRRVCWGWQWICWCAEGGTFYSLHHRVHTKGQLQLSGVHSIMMEKLAQPGEGWGCTPTPFHHIYHHVQSCCVYAPAERAGIIPLISTLPHMYSVLYTTQSKNVSKMGLIFRSIECMPKMQCYMTCRFMLQTLRRYAVKPTLRLTRHALYTNKYKECF